MYRNYYNGGNFVQKTPEQYVNDFQNLLSQYQGMYNKNTISQNTQPQMQTQQTNNNANTNLLLKSCKKNNFKISIKVLKKERHF